MRMSILSALALVAAVQLPACPTAPKPPPGPIDGGAPVDDTPCAKACNHLRELSCPEGAEPACSETCKTATGTVLPAAWPQCVIDAGTVEAVRGCRTRCQR